jgi:hypothetical protein
MQRPIIPTVLPNGYSCLPEAARQIDAASRLLTIELQGADRRSRRAELIYEARLLLGETGRILGALVELL